MHTYTYKRIYSYIVWVFPRLLLLIVSLNEGLSLIGNTLTLRLWLRFCWLVAAVFVPLHACVRVCVNVCVFAHFLNICQSAPYPQKSTKKKERESRNFFAGFAISVVVVCCLPLPGRFSFNNQFFFLSVLWAWLVYFLLFSLVFFHVVIFGHLLPTYLPTMFSLQATYATACTHILEAVRVVRVFFFHLISLQGELPAN